eukprot:scaffold18416_cov63-Attheya_sp.AAC.3
MGAALGEHTIDHSKNKDDLTNNDGCINPLPIDRFFNDDIAIMSDLKFDDNSDSQSSLGHDILDHIVDNSCEPDHISLFCLEVVDKSSSQLKKQASPNHLLGQQVRSLYNAILEESNGKSVTKGVGSTVL